MICSSLFCLENQARHETTVHPSRIRFDSVIGITGSQKQDPVLLSQLARLKNQQLSSISSHKSNSRHSSSSSTMINTEEMGSKGFKMHAKRFSNKISISDMRKIQTMKKMSLLSTSSSVQRLEIESETKSIIDKLEGVSMEGKAGLGLNGNMGDGEKTEIFLPQPKHFLLKWKKI